MRNILFLALLLLSAVPFSASADGGRRAVSPYDGAPRFQPLPTRRAATAQSRFAAATSWGETPATARQNQPATAPARQIQPAQASGRTPNASAQNPLIATIEYSDNMSTDYGVYRFDTGQWSWQMLSEPIGDTYCGGAALVDDLYYAVRYVNSGGVVYAVAYAYDTTTWKISTTHALPPTCIANDMTTDPTTGRVYGCFYNDAGTAFVFGYADLETGERTAIADAGTKGWHAVMADAAGQIYAITWDGVLLKVDKTTGAVVRVGETGVSAAYSGTAAIDPATGVCYWAVCTAQSSNIYTVDLATGAATVVKNFPYGEEIQGGYVAAPAAEAAAPAAPSGAAADFPRGALTGTVRFDAPTTLFSGDAAPAGEALTWRVSTGGETLATGQTSYGAAVEAAVGVAKAGRYRFHITVENAHGPSPKATLTTWVGPDAPAAPDTVRLSRTGGTFHVAWSAVTTSANGGYIDPQAIIYKVTRQPDGVVVARTAQTECDDAVDDTGAVVAYTYAVQATYDGNEGEAATSAPYVLGANRTPWSEDFQTMTTTEDVKRAFTIIDANNDGNTWEFRKAVSKDGGVMRCQYNAAQDMDDWLITPPVALEGGNAYVITVNAFSYRYDTPERFEVRAGRGNTAAAMTESVVVPTWTRNDSQSGSDFTGTLTAPESGTYFIGIHGMSPKDLYWLQVQRVSVSEPVAADVPGPATDFTVVPDPDGTAKLTLHFRAPATDLNGSALAGTVDIHIARDGEDLHTLSGAAPGSALTYDDLTATKGNHTYTLTAENDYGAGRAVSATGFAGVNVPQPPTAATIAETATEGEVRLTWQAPQADIAGFPVKPEFVSYAVCKRQGNESVAVAEGITATEHTLQAVEKGRQDFVFYGIYAETEGGRSATPAYTAMIPAGKPFALPYEDSFGAGSPGYPVATETLSGTASWQVAEDASYTDISSADADNGFLIMFGDAVGAASRMATGKIALAGAAPHVSFQYFSPDAACQNSFELQVMDGGVWHTAGTWSCAGAAGWRTAEADLAAYAGRTVQIGIVSRIGSADRPANMLDNLRVLNLVAHNLHASVVEAPSKLRAGVAAEISVPVANYGTQTASGYTVALWRNGRQVAEAAGEAVAAGATGRVVFRHTVPTVEAQELSFRAVINYADDADPADNTTAEAAAMLLYNPAFPAIDTLTGQYDSATGTASLAWEEAPDGGDVEMTEDFENSPAFELPHADVQEWTFHDEDGIDIGDWSYLKRPDLRGPASWFVVDDRDASLGLPKYFAAHSGHRTLCAMYSYDYSTKQSLNDEWAVSPVLNGAAQTLRLWAKSWTLISPETFHVLVSTTGTDVDDFQEVETVVVNTMQWKEYSFALPAGTRHFALRYTSQDCMMLLVDDVSFTPGRLGLGLVGYNVYRDGTLISGPDFDEMEFVDEAAPAVGATYQVSVRYDRGESLPSNAVTLGTTGIDPATATPAAWRATAHAGTLTVSGAAGRDLTISTAAGATVWRGTAPVTLRLALPGGVYVVRAGRESRKVAVF